MKHEDDWEIDSDALRHADHIESEFGDRLIMQARLAAIQRRSVRSNGKVLICSEDVDAARLTLLATPTTRVRPFTPVEAAAHLGRCFKTKYNTLKLDVVKEKHVGSVENDERFFRLTYEQFAECTWADSGEPCGVVEGR